VICTLANKACRFILGAQMDTALTEISLQGLIIAVLPVAIVIGIMVRWSVGAPTAIYATLRMLIQLLLLVMCWSIFSIPTGRYSS